MADEIYIHDGASDELERERFDLMAKLYDAATHDLLSSSIDLAGARVLEVGAGTGRVAEWLGDQVGPDGQVIATDIDLRFLSALDHPQVVVKEHNIVTDPINDGPFDLIHGRFVLTHLFAHAELLIEKLAEALAPGGCVAFEEADYGTNWAADRDHPRAQAWSVFAGEPPRILREAGAIDAEFGRRLPPLFHNSSLTGVKSSARYDISAPGSDWHRFHELSLRSNRPVASQVPGLKDEWWDIMLEAMGDETFHFGEMTVVRSVGYRQR
ncbi:MAG: methyltransferase domain-containing protein [Actinomycetia bacterium]|nr:methyltransferase domain-containing protein [Actinomycetes bacterium]